MVQRDLVHAIKSWWPQVEMKGRRRLITEPHLNGVLSKAEIPRCEYPSRLARRQELRYARYMLQIDFEAYYDSIPLMDEGLRNKFVFRARDGALYRLRTLPTGARWSVAVGQAVTWTIVDIDTRRTILTMIDNILIAAHAGEEVEFVRTVRQIVDRIEVANLCTSPSREEVRSWSDSVMLEEARKTNVFLGRGVYLVGRGTQGAQLHQDGVETEAGSGTATAQEFHVQRICIQRVTHTVCVAHHKVEPRFSV
ncbi:TATE DNA transposon [Trypanosoma theileri]|uniref:TATE DNA transposon n=1 Tax=Trypanosoma theileri TaxID=67003 RepID=A0A1X0NM49_9TRYP|nr:TATE DNA transposon [Trypanosoma theileri]ORC85651.1 TATE DNA transposon [Trypanosoma theileri]